MECGIDPRVDFAFKRLFGDPRNSHLAKSLINATFEDSSLAPIVDLQFLNPFNLQETPTDKLSILDIKARDATGRQINLEMQMLVSRTLCPRIVFYLADLHSSQLQSGQDYDTLCPTISIVFVNQILFPDVDKVHSRFQMCDKSCGIVFSNQIEIHVIELPRLLSSLKSPSSALEQWVYFFLNAREFDMNTLPGTLTIPEIYAAMEELDRMRGTPAERLKYMERDRELRAALTWEKEKAEMAKDKVEMAKDKIELAEGRALLAEGKAELAEGNAELTERQAELAEREAELARREAEFAKRQSGVKES